MDRQTDLNSDELFSDNRKLEKNRLRSSSDNTQFLLPTFYVVDSYCGCVEVEKKIASLHVAS